MRYVFRHFPYSQAQQATGRQGMFWQMHDLLFTNQHALDNGDLAEHAALLEIDGVQFLQDLSGDVYAHWVQEDLHSGIQSGVCRTPAFFTNRLRYDEACNKETLIAALTQQR